MKQNLPTILLFIISAFIDISCFAADQNNTTTKEAKELAFHVQNPLLWLSMEVANLNAHVVALNLRGDALTAQFISSEQLRIKSAAIAIFRASTCDMQFLRNIKNIFRKCTPHLSSYFLAIEFTLDASTLLEKLKILKIKSDIVAADADKVINLTQVKECAQRYRAELSHLMRLYMRQNPQEADEDCFMLSFDIKESLLATIEIAELGLEEDVLLSSDSDDDDI